jgi:glutamyl-tRNA synthetase
VGNALTAAANRAFGDWMLLRVDDTDTARNVPGGEDAIVRDLQWLGIEWDEGPVRQSDRQDRYRKAAEQLGGDRFGKITLLRPDGTATYHLASVVDDIAFEITHVIRGSDHRPNEALHRELTVALGGRPPEYVHHGLILGPDGRKLSKRDPISSIADLRDAGIPPEAVRAYLDELGLPRHDVQLDVARIRRLAVEAIAAMSDEELAARVGVSLELVPALRGARDLGEARDFARQILEPEPVTLPGEARPTLERFRELANGDARETVRELKAAGGDLRALRLALTGRERGPELWTVLHALTRDEALRRVDASLAAPGRRRQGRQASGAQDSIQKYGQAPRAPDPAADGVSPSRSPAPPGEDEGRPVP